MTGNLLLQSQLSDRLIDIRPPPPLQVESYNNFSVLVNTVDKHNASNPLSLE